MPHPVITTEQAAALLRLARAVVAEHKRRLSVPYPPASKPGEYPRKRTGNLRRSIVYRHQTVREIAQYGEVRVGTLDRADYGNVLQMKYGRRGLKDTVKDLIGAGVPGVRWTHYETVTDGMG